MKKVLSIIAVAALGLLCIVSCNRGPKSDLEGFKKTESGLHYKFEVENKNAQQVQMGDMIIGHMVLRLENDTLFTSPEESCNILTVNEPMFAGDITEGLLMMHNGDKAIFAVDADAMAEKLEPSQMPVNYASGQKMKLYYEITITDIKTAAQLAEDKAKFENSVEKLAADEKSAIEAYVNDNAIKETPREDGLYVIVKKKGNGTKVSAGKSVRIEYTGKLLNGKIFDSSNKDVAKENGLEPHDALEYVVGEASLIRGWEEGILNMPQGTQLTLLIPSELAYGTKGSGDAIPPYSPLLFDITIVSVK